MNRDFKGVWIDKEIWLNKELTWMEKLFITEINSLDNKDGCFASNDYFADFFQLSKGRCSQIINSLIRKKYISSEHKYKGKVIEKRVLRILNTPIKNIKGGIKNTKQGYLENAIDNNTLINNTSNNTCYENSYFSILQTEYNEYNEAYPDINIDQELKKMKLWLDANPTKHKKNYKRFITNWLSNHKKYEPDKEDDEIYLGDGLYKNKKTGEEYERKQND